MLGIVSGTRRDRLDIIKGDTMMKVQQPKEAMLDSEAWRTLAYKVAKSCF